ncbi:MAG: OmpA family protein [Paracoccaceae bacterium]
MTVQSIAQEMTAEEILALLQAQREALAQEDTTSLGNSRTLEFVTESTPETAAGISVGTEMAGDALAVAAGDGTAAMPEELVIDLTIFFEFDSALLKPESREQVLALCNAIQTAGGEGKYQIIGHTDAAGSVQYNLSLSTARAQEVVRYMVDTCDIPADRLEAVGMGQARLKDPEDPRADINRRVEIQVLL